MAGPRSPTSLVTAQLISRRWRIISLGCCADFQQRSNERMVVLPQTHFRSFHGVEDFSHLDGMKLFKNIRTYGWAVFPQNTAQFLSLCWKTFSSDVMQPCKHFPVDGWAALPNIPCHGPAHFAALKNHFFLMLCRLSTTFKWMAGCVPPNTAQLFSRCWKHFFLDGIKRFKNIRTYGWAVLPQTRPSSFHGVKEPFRVDVLQPLKHTQVHGWAALPKWRGRAPHPLSRPSSCQSVEKSFRFDVMQIFNNVQMNGWSCSLKHGPGHFTVLKTLYIWMVRTFSKTFELMAGPCSPKHGPVPFTVLKNHFVWMLCSHVKTFKFMAGPRSPTPLVTAQLISRRWRIISFWCCADF